MISPAREKRISLGGAHLALALDERQVQRIRRTAPFRYVVRPAVNWLRRRVKGVAESPAAPLIELAHPERPDTPEARAVVEAISGIDWYHSIELPHGVVTRGFTDHRPQVPLYGLPDDLRGMRALDVATNDGFWAFEMERRGAEVTCIDIANWGQFDTPRCFLDELERSGAHQKVTGDGFRAAHTLLKSRVDRKILSVYNLSPETVGGTFDLVFLSDLLLHLRDPQRALENVASVVRPGGMAIIGDVYSPALEHISGMNVTEYVAYGTHVWWRPSVRTLRAMMTLAGFKRIEEISRFRLAATTSDEIAKVVLHGYLS